MAVARATDGQALPPARARAWPGLVADSPCQATPTGSVRRTILGPWRRRRLGSSPDVMPADAVAVRRGALTAKARPTRARARKTGIGAAARPVRAGGWEAPPLARRARCGHGGCCSRRRLRAGPLARCGSLGALKAKSSSGPLPSLSLLPASGPVGPGVWARRLRGVESGSQGSAVPVRLRALGCVRERVRTRPCARPRLSRVSRAAAPLFQNLMRPLPAPALHGRLCARCAAAPPR